MVEESNCVIGWCNHMEWEAQIFTWACYLYYHTGVESPLSDSTFDFTISMLEKYWDDTPFWFRERIVEAGGDKTAIKTAAHGYEITEHDKHECAKWLAYCWSKVGDWNVWERDGFPMLTEAYQALGLEMAESTGCKVLEARERQEVQKNVRLPRGGLEDMFD